MISIRSTASSLALALGLALASPAAWAGVGNADSSAGEDDDAPAAPTAPTTSATTAPAPSATTVATAVPVAPIAVAVAAAALSAGGDGRCLGGQPASGRPAPPPRNAAAAQAVGEADAVVRIAAEGRALLAVEAKPLDAVSYCSASGALADRGEYRAAIQAAGMALFLGQQYGDKTLLAHAARGLAYAYSLAGALDQAERWADETLRFAARLKDARAGEALHAPALKVKGDVALRQGRAAEAATLYRQALAKLGQSALKPWYTVALAQAALAQGQAARAAQSLAEARRDAPPALLPALGRAEAEVALKQGDAARAASLFKVAADAAGDDAYVRMWSLHGLGRAQRAGGNKIAALASFVEAAQSADAVRGRFRSEEFKSGFFGSAQDIFDDAVAAAADAGTAEQALDLSERSRSRALLDLLIGRVQPAGAGLTFVDRVAAAEPVAALRPYLPRDAAVVVYHVLDEQSIAWVLRAGEIRQVVLPTGRRALGPRIAELLEAIRGDARDVAPRAAALNAALVAPLDLRSDEPMLAVAHDVLYLLPFGALHDGKAWLVERRAVASLPSLNALAALVRAPPAASGGALVMGNPDLGDAAYDLPAAGQEAAAIAQRLKGAVLYTRGQATRERLAAEAPGRRLIHIAAHATVDELDPLASPLYLAGNGTQAAMTARDFYSIDLRQARLIALSACETGLGKVGRGNEFWGFQRTVMGAGARGLLVSLWPVEDEATAALMARFYELVGTRPAMTALRQAQLDLLRQYRDRPILWAGFMLAGDWR
ncbi:MAG: CHAT domain-containing protein [Alphaproteobacteria bacterium]|nr:CHAT domain-containing protein [Alphaproteobacteria bacterium]